MGQQRRQVIKEAVRVVEYLDGVGVELVPGSDVAIALGEEGVPAIEAVEEPQEPLLVGPLLLDLLQQGSDGGQALCVPFTDAVEGLDCLDDVSQYHFVRRRVGHRPAGVDVLGLGHEHLPSSHHVHELD